MSSPNASGSSSAPSRLALAWTNVKGRESYDNKAIREAAAKAGVDVEQYQTVGEPTDRLTISVSP